MRLQHSLIGSIDFVSVNKPVVTSNAHVIRMVIDENAYLMPLAGLKFVWMLYVPRDGEEVRVATIEDFGVEAEG